jgi:hypothetical protein
VERIRTDNGAELDASFRVERVGNLNHIIWESRGGTRGSAEARNADYAEGLELLLRRLASSGLRLGDVWVDSRDTSTTPPAERRVVLEGDPYPITITDAGALRRKLSAAQARVGRARGAKGGGNQTRRLRIALEGPEVSPARLAASLRSGAAPTTNDGD